MKEIQPWRGPQVLRGGMHGWDSVEAWGRVFRGRYQRECDSDKAGGLPTIRVALDVKKLYPGTRRGYSGIRVRASRVRALAYHLQASDTRLVGFEGCWEGFALKTAVMLYPWCVGNRTVPGKVLRCPSSTLGGGERVHVVSSRVSANSAGGFSPNADPPPINNTSMKQIKLCTTPCAVPFVTSIRPGQKTTLPSSDIVFYCHANFGQ